MNFYIIINRILFSITLIVLFILGFGTTQKSFGVFNIDYFVTNLQNRSEYSIILKEMEEISIRKALLVSSISAILERSKNADSEVDRLRNLPNYDRQASQPGFGPIQRAQKMQDEARQQLEKQLEPSNSQLNKLDADYKVLTERRKNLTDQLNAISTDGSNIYLVTRALSLGALGALTSILFKFAIDSSKISFHTHNPKRTYVSLMIGAVVALVIFGLFYIKQITIFRVDDNSQTVPDYWRTTILCLISGAFAERIFLAAGGKVDRYLGGESEKNS